MHTLHAYTCTACGEIHDDVMVCSLPFALLSGFVVSGRAKDIRISQQSLVKFVNKSTFLYALSLERVQLVYMVSPPRDVYNVESPTCMSSYYMYRMWRLLLGRLVEVLNN